MKKIIFTLIAILSMSAATHAMSYEQARNEALFLTDKMAYELNLTDAQYEAAYEINLDYLMCVSGRHDVFGSYWERRNMDLQYILYTWQWEAFRAATYFYRPLYWNAGYWHFGIYARYPHRTHFYFGRPHFYATYRGGHSWRSNGGRSYYEHHRAHYRPASHHSQHSGMRDGWNRGDFQNRHGNSSTRVTGRNNSLDNTHRNNDNVRHGSNNSTRNDAWRRSDNNNRTFNGDAQRHSDNNNRTFNNDASRHNDNNNRTFNNSTRHNSINNHQGQHTGRAITSTRSNSISNSASMTRSQPSSSRSSAISSHASRASQSSGTSRHSAGGRHHHE